MVANLSAHKKGWDERWFEFSKWAEKGKKLQSELLQLVDDDTDAYKLIMEAYSLPKKSEEENELRKTAIQEATKKATLIPFQVMETAFRGFSLIKEMVEKGNPNSVTDAGVGALALRSCIKGAFMNVRINVSSLEDKNFVSDILDRGREIELQTQIMEEEILKNINEKLKI
jgi:glutamate formiminotransferase/formiminotetrahydrofolate cyclodeaminase